MWIHRYVHVAICFSYIVAFPDFAKLTTQSMGDVNIYQVLWLPPFLHDRVLFPYIISKLSIFKYHVRLASIGSVGKETCHHDYEQGSWSYNMYPGFLRNTCYASTQFDVGLLVLGHTWLQFKNDSLKTSIIGAQLLHNFLVLSFGTHILLYWW